MSDPFEKAAASLPPTVGEGCLRRFDPDQMDEELGTEFSGAAALWKESGPVIGEESHLSPEPQNR